MSAIIKRGNAEFTVDESEVEKYLAQGYDQIDANGKTVKQASAGKTITVEEHNKAINALKAEIAKLGKKNAAE